MEWFLKKEAKTYFEFRIQMRREKPVRKPDLVRDDAGRKWIYIIDMSCPVDRSIAEKLTKKLRNMNSCLSKKGKKK